MHDKVKDFVEDLHRNPPADLAEWLGVDSDRRLQHFREFDLDDLSDPKHARRVEDAKKVLPKLIERAKQGRTMTFTQFVQFVGRGNARSTNGRAINPIVALCVSRDLPPLWTLVVSSGTGLGPGYWREHTDAEKIARQENCFTYYGSSRAEPLPQAKTSRRMPNVSIRETCPACFTELTPAGSCLC